MPTRSKEDIIAEIDDVEIRIDCTRDDLADAEGAVRYAENELMDLEDLLYELQDELSRWRAEDEAE